MAVIRTPRVVLYSPVQAETGSVHPRGVSLPFDIFLFALYVDRPGVIPGRDVEESGSRAVGRRIPVRRALIAGEDACALERRRLARYGNGTALAVESAHPGHLCVRLAREELARGAIEHVIEPVAV